MTQKVDELTHRGSATPLSTTPVVGMPAREYPSTMVPGTEPLDPGEIRVTVLAAATRGSAGARRRDRSWSRSATPRRTSSSSTSARAPSRTSTRWDSRSSPRPRSSSRTSTPTTSATSRGCWAASRRRAGSIPSRSGAVAARIPPWGSRPSASTWARPWRGTRRPSVGSVPRRLPGVGPRDRLRPAGYDLRPQRRRDLQLPGHPRAERRGGLRHRVRGPEGRVLGRHASLPPRGGGRGWCRPADPRVLPVPAVFARATGLPLETAKNLTRLAHTVPEQMGKILARTQPRMGALWHLDLTPGVDAVFDELSVNYQEPVTISQDFTVFNVTEEAVVARQATVNDAAPPVHGPSQRPPHRSPCRPRRRGGPTRCSTSDPEARVTGAKARPRPGRRHGPPLSCRPRA